MFHIKLIKVALYTLMASLDTIAVVFYSTIILYVSDLLYNSEQ